MQGEIAKAGGLYKWLQKQMKGRKITRADVEARAENERERVYLTAWLLMFNLYDKRRQGANMAKVSKASGYGNRKTKVVHNTARNDSCRQSEIKRGNLVKFALLTDALEEGYRKCKRCRWGHGE